MLYFIFIVSLYFTKIFIHMPIPIYINIMPCKFVTAVHKNSKSWWFLYNFKVRFFFLVFPFFRCCTSSTRSWSHWFRIPSARPNTLSASTQKSCWRNRPSTTSEAKGSKCSSIKPNSVSGKPKTKWSRVVQFKWRQRIVCKLHTYLNVAKATEVQDKRCWTMYGNKL